MDKIQKALKKLSPTERKKFKSLLLLIQTGQLDTLDVKKLKGSENIYRVRKGNYRIIFQKKSEAISILAFETRGERTYQNW